MDHKQIQSLVESSLTGINVNGLTLNFEDDSVIRVEVVSNDFVGVRLLKRIDLISKKLTNLSTNELFDYQLVYNPLTSNEKLHGISETEDVEFNSNTTDDGTLVTVLAENMVRKDLHDEKYGKKRR